MNALNKSYKDMTIFVHPEVERYLKGGKDSDINIKKKLEYCVDQFLNYGTLQNLYPLEGAGKGWFRTPLSRGSNGKTHYLWLSIGTNSFGKKKIGLNDNEIYFREVRHHDLNSRKLTHGDFKKYKKYTLKNRKVADSEVYLTPKQVDAVYSTNDITLIEGLPGTGKTTVLHKKSDALKNQKQLYLTYSNSLTYLAEKTFGYVQKNNNKRRAMTFNDFFSELAKINDQLYYMEKKETNYEYSKNNFKSFLESDAKVNYSNWKDNIKALYTEVYAYAFGSLDEDFNFNESNHREYVFNNFKKRKKALDSKEYDQAKNVITRIFEEDKATELFPTLTLCFNLVTKLKDNKILLPEVLTSLDMIMVDEVQDLTKLESYAVFLFSKITQKNRKIETHFVIAGDEAQTVRPTNFTWSEFKNMIYDVNNFKVENIDSNNFVEHINLDESLRSPSQISNFLYAMRYFYSNIDKKERPSVKEFSGNTEDQYGRVVYYSAKNESEFKGLINKINELPSGIAIHTGIKSYENSKNIKLSNAEDVKGLDFSTVAVVDLGKTLVELKELIKKSKSTKKYDSVIRSTIDNIMVAVSRPTHTLILLDNRLEDDFSKRHNINNEDLLAEIENLYNNAGISIEDNTINTYQNSNDLLNAIDFTIDREDYIRTKMSQFKKAILDNPTSITESLYLLFDEAKQQKLDGKIEEDLFNELVDIVIQHSVSLLLNKSIDNKNIESFEKFYSSVLEIKYPDGKYFTEDTSNRSKKEKQMYDTFFEMTKYYQPNSTFQIKLNYVSKILKNYKPLANELNSVITLVDRLILDWHANLLSEKVANKEQVKKVLSITEKIKKVLLKNDKDKELDLNLLTKKILINWAETTEKAKKYEVSLYINQLLNFYISAVRVYKLMGKYKEATKYIENLSPKAQAEIEKKEKIVLPELVSLINELMNSNHLYQPELKVINEKINEFKKAS